MKNEIIVGVVTSVVTAVLAFAVANFLGLLERNLKKEQVLAVAKELINNDTNRDLLLYQMEKSEKFKGKTGERGIKGKKGDKGDKGEKGKDGEWISGAAKPLSNIARQICYSALSGLNDHSLITIPLKDSSVDLDYICHTTINDTWHAGGIAKSNYFTQNCDDLENFFVAGGGYTSFVTEKRFEENRKDYSNCNESNAFICCSPQFPN